MPRRACVLKPFPFTTVGPRVRSHASHPAPSDAFLSTAVGAWTFVSSGNRICAPADQQPGRAWWQHWAKNSDRVCLNHSGHCAYTTNAGVLVLMLGTNVMSTTTTLPRSIPIGRGTHTPSHRDRQTDRHDTESHKVHIVGLHFCH